MNGFETAPLTDSLLGRRNPTVKLGLLCVVSLVALFVLDPVTPTVLYLLALVAVALSTGVALRVLVVAHLPFVAFATGALLVNALTRPGTVLWQAGVLQVTHEGVGVGVALAARTLLIGVLAIGFLLCTDAVALMTSLHHNARLGARVTYAVLAGYRMLQEMPREWTSIRHAHAVRADLRHQPDGAPAPSPSGVRHLARVVFTLLVVSVRKGERLSQALECRGLGLQPRTTWRPVPVTGTDRVFAGAVLLVLAAVLGVSAALGVLAGPGRLVP